MILGRVPDERAAPKRFYEWLADHRADHHARKARVVATIQGLVYRIPDIYAGTESKRGHPTSDA